VQSPTVLEAVRDVVAEVQRADHPFNERLEVASPLPSKWTHSPPSLVAHAHYDRTTRPPLWLPGRLGSAGQLPRATFAVLDRAGHLVNIEQGQEPIA